MKIKEIFPLLNAKVLTEAGGLDHEVTHACGCDMMSDVLAYVKDQAVLLTGLVNPQVIRTVLMVDIVCVVFVRGKKPTPEMLELAEKNGIVVMTTDMCMYEACGKLYSVLTGTEKA